MLLLNIILTNDTEQKEGIFKSKVRAEIFTSILNTARVSHGYGNEKVSYREPGVQCSLPASQISLREYALSGGGECELEI